MTNPCAVFDYTFSKDKVSDDEVKAFLKEYAKKWAYQEEIGKETGYKHFQSRFSLHRKRRHNEMVSVMKDYFGNERINTKALTPTSNANRTNMFYVLKSDTSVAGTQRTDKDEDFYIPRQVREIKVLRGFQKEIIDDLKVWNTRSINVLIDTKGNIGKSVLCSWIRCYRLGRILPALNDAKDLMRATYCLPTARGYLLDLPRALDKRRLAEMYSAIEQIKSGYCYDDRYEYKEKVFDSPNIWIFTNQIPDLRYMSLDRWKLWKINDENDLEKLNLVERQGQTQISIEDQEF